MDSRHVEALMNVLSLSQPRRRLVAILTTLPVASGLLALTVPEETRGKRRHKRRKRKKKPTPTCTPNPASQTCAGQCGTVTNNCQQAVDCGSCVCDVRCVDTAAACGAALQVAIDTAAEGATLIVCPGTYQGGFTISKALTIIGAGQSENPSRSTILDGNTSQRVVTIPRNTGVVTLQRLLITRGEVGTGAGGGIFHSGTQLVMHDCTVAHNQGRSGGGISHNAGALEMTRCTVRNNIAVQAPLLAAKGGGLDISGRATFTDCVISNNETAGTGGGLFTNLPLQVVLAGTTRVRDNMAGAGGGIFGSTSSITVGADCRITGNTAETGQGGGINNFGSTVTLEGPDPSPIVVDNCHENCVGTVLKCQSGGTCPA